MMATDVKVFTTAIAAGNRPTDLDIYLGAPVPGTEIGTVRAIDECSYEARIADVTATSMSPQTAARVAWIKFTRSAGNTIPIDPAK